MSITELTGNAFTVEHVEFGGLERRGHLVLDHLDARAVAHRLRRHSSGFEYDECRDARRHRTSGLAAGGGFGIAEEHADLFTQLVDEDGGGAGLSQRAGHLAQRLTHESGLQTNMAVSHFAFDFASALGRRPSR